MAKRAAKTVYVTTSNVGTKDEFRNVDRKLDAAVKAAEENEEDVIDVAEYQLVRAFKAQRVTKVTEI